MNGLCVEQIRRVASIPGTDKNRCGSTEHCIYAVEILNVPSVRTLKIQKAAGANVGRFVLIICITFFSLSAAGFEGQ